MVSNDTFTKILLLVIGLGIIGATFAYIILAIKFLVEDYDLWRDCDDSNLWIYVLVSLIISYNKSNTSSANNNDNDNYITFCIMCIIELGFATWGGIELFNKTNSCPELQDSGLYDIAMITFILQLLFGSLIIIFPSVMAVIYYIDKYKNPVIDNIQDNLPTTSQI